MSSASCGGGRGIYSHVDGDLPPAARTNVPARPVAHWNDPDRHSCNLEAGAAGSLGGSLEPRGYFSASERSSVPLDTRHSQSQQAERAPGSLTDTRILHVNIRGLRSHLAELCAVIRWRAPPPDTICVNESFLDSAVEEVEIKGFDLVGATTETTGNVVALLFSQGPQLLTT